MKAYVSPMPGPGEVMVALRCSTIGWTELSQSIYLNPRQNQFGIISPRVDLFRILTMIPDDQTEFKYV